MPRKAHAFVKSSTTSTPAERSRGELEQLLRRYGAHGFSVAQDYANGRFQISFVVANSAREKGTMIPVRIPIAIADVYRAMYGDPGKDSPDRGRMAQAERVAWRQMLLWIDSALSAAALNIQTIEEAFFAHAVISGPRGPERLIDSMRTDGSLPRLLLPGPGA